MKRLNGLAVIIVCALLALTLSSCAKSEFSAEADESGKQITITAEHADKDDFFLVGSLEVEEGEQIEIAPSLTEGAVRLELLGMPEEQSADELPDMDGTPVASADVSGTEGLVESAAAGSYSLKATCLERTTGTIQLDVKSAK